MTAYDPNAYDPSAFDTVFGSEEPTRPDFTQDHGLVAWQHWPAQFNDGTRLEALVRALHKPLNDIEAALLQLLTDRAATRRTTLDGTVYRRPPRVMEWCIPNFRIRVAAWH